MIQLKYKCDLEPSLVKTFQYLSTHGMRSQFSSVAYKFLQWCSTRRFLYGAFLVASMSGEMLLASILCPGARDAVPKTAYTMTSPTQMATTEKLSSWFLHFSSLPEGRYTTLLP